MTEFGGLPRNLQEDGLLDFVNLQMKIRPNPLHPEMCACKGPCIGARDAPLVPEILLTDERNS